ncbi:hypothetical protein ABPG74_010478 [Tetrahymena malaccensis]
MQNQREFLNYNLNISITFQKKYLFQQIRVILNAKQRVEKPQIQNKNCLLNLQNEVNQKLLCQNQQYLLIKYFLNVLLFQFNPQVKLINNYLAKKQSSNFQSQFQLVKQKINTQLQHLKQQVEKQTTNIIITKKLIKVDKLKFKLNNQINKQSYQNYHSFIYLQSPSNKTL